MGMGCEVVYGADGVESCIWLRCKVVYGTGGVESCMGWDARSCMEQVVSNHVWGEMRGRVWPMNLPVSFIYVKSIEIY